MSGSRGKKRIVINVWVPMPKKRSEIQAERAAEQAAAARREDEERALAAARAEEAAAAQQEAQAAQEALAAEQALAMQVPPTPPPPPPMPVAPLTAATVPPPPHVAVALPRAQLKPSVRQMFAMDDDEDDQEHAVAAAAAEEASAPKEPAGPQEQASAEEPDAREEEQATKANAHEEEQADKPNAQEERVAEPGAQAAEPDAQEVGAQARSTTALIERLWQVPRQCFRCNQTHDGIWHTFASAAAFYRALYAVSERREDVGAEQRWYAVLQQAGIARGDECTALRWPLPDAAPDQMAKVHPLARSLVELLCETVVHEQNGAFVEQIVMPSLLCLHEQALHRHTTMRQAEEALELEELSVQPNVDSLLATQRELRELRAQLPWSLPLTAVAQVCCAVVGAPSRGMPCAYQTTKYAVATHKPVTAPTAHYEPLVLPSLPYDALPPGLHRSLEIERPNSHDCPSPRAFAVGSYSDLFAR